MRSSLSPPRLVAAVLLAAAGLSAQEPARPSFVVFIADDQRWDCLGSAGHPVLRTPHLDRLAAEGLRFSEAFTTTSICCVSRASFYTGRLARRHAVGDFSTPLRPEELTASFPARLRAAGYRTGCFGKWGIGGPPPREVFDVWDATGGQGEYFTELDGERVHNSERLARQAVGFLRSQPRDRPFCLLVLYKSPHDPYLPDPRDAELFHDAVFPVPRTYHELDFARFPDFIRESEGRRRLLKSHPTPEAYQEFVRQYLRCLAGVDRSVGKVLGALAELGLSSLTTVVYTSDNGFFLGEHGLTHKWLMHEESIRIPWIVRSPRVPAALRGRRREEMVLNIDLAPTLLDLAGLPASPGTDGRSLLPLLAEEGAPAWREELFYEHHFSAREAPIPRTEGVRTREWKYIDYPGAVPAFEELYDLRRDPQETRNLAFDARRREVLVALRARCEEHRRALGPPVLPRAAAGEAAPLRRLLYVAVPGIRDYLEYGGHGVLVFDIDDRYRFLRRIASAGLDEGGKPLNVKGICASADTDRLYLSTLRTLTCFDLRTDRILWERSYEGGCDRMSLTPDGKTIYLPSLEKAHWHVVDAVSGEVRRRIEPGSGAHNTIVGPDGKEAYLAGLRSPHLTVADAARMEAVRTVGPFGAPIRPFTVNGSGTLCFVNVNGLLGFEVGDLRSGKPLHRVEVEGYRPGPVKRHGCPSHGIALTPDEKELWLADAANRRLHVFDAAAMPPRQAASIELRDEPGWVTFSIDGRWAYPSTGEVIDTSTRKITALLRDENGVEVQSEKLLEIDFRGADPIQAGDQFGIGRKPAR